MNDKIINITSKILKETFHYDGNIKNPTQKQLMKINEKINETNFITSDEIGEIYTDDNGRFGNFKLQSCDFDAEELSKRVEIAESIYELYKKPVTIAVLCPKDVDVLVKECPIKSEADFTIKLSTLADDTCSNLLKFIKNKTQNNEKLSAEELEVLSILPIMCKKEERHYYRTQYLNIISNLHY